MQKLKLRKIGNSVGVILPKEALAAHRLEAEDDLFLIETSQGLELRLYDPDVAEQLDRGRDVAKRYRSALRELAK